MVLMVTTSPVMQHPPLRVLRWHQRHNLIQTRGGVRGGWLQNRRVARPWQRILCLTSCQHPSSQRRCLPQHTPTSRTCPFRPLHRSAQARMQTLITAISPPNCMTECSFCGSGSLGCTHKKRRSLTDRTAVDLTRTTISTIIATVTRPAHRSSEAGAHATNSTGCCRLRPCSRSRAMQQQQERHRSNCFGWTRAPTEAFLKANLRPSGISAARSPVR